PGSPGSAAFGVFGARDGAALATGEAHGAERPPRTGAALRTDPWGGLATGPWRPRGPTPSGPAPVHEKPLKEAPRRRQRT
ncbi:hypothetical protein, partial [Streptomyces griseus]|uniref:hypothetical protein n=1 Tax=Streptomyces griseus TaxID=1911 RepID=UPI0036BAFE8E